MKKLSLALCICIFTAVLLIAHYRSTQENKKIEAELRSADAYRDSINTLVQQYHTELNVEYAKKSHLNRNKDALQNEMDRLGFELEFQKSFAEKHHINLQALVNVLNPQLPDQFTGNF